MRDYYTVLERDNPQSPWAVHFGSYSEEEAYDEAQELCDDGYRAVNVKVIRSGDTQQEIDAAVLKYQPVRSPRCENCDDLLPEGETGPHCSTHCRLAAINAAECHGGAL